MKMKALFVSFCAAIAFLSSSVPQAQAVVAFDNIPYVASIDSIYYYAAGFKFKTNEVIKITQLGYYSDLNDCTVGFFDSTGSSIISMAVNTNNTSASIDGYRYASLTTPITLAANSIFTFAGLGKGMRYEVNGPLNFNPAITFMNSVTNATESSTLAFNCPPAWPDYGYGNTYYGLSANFQFDRQQTEQPAPVPEPSSLIMLLSGFAGIGGFSITRKFSRR